MNFLQRTCILLLLCCPLAARADDAGWVDLFDGETLDGWIQKNGTATYRVEDGTIVGRTNTGSPNSFLTTAETYGDFELEFEVKCDNRLNSGVQIRSQTVDASDDDEAAGNWGRVNGPQCEIEAANEEGALAGYIYGEATEYGWLSAEEDRVRHPHYKNEEWNHYRILCEGSRIRSWINGEPVADLTHEQIYETHPRGFIGLQVHGIPEDQGPYEVAWRNIRIRVLDDEQASAGEWIPLFNGRDLTGWTPKIRGYELGVNHADTFRVVDGAIQVNYDGYDSFDEQFGHLFYNEPFSNYMLEVEYRFTGDQCPNGPGWAIRNSGVMVHGESPEQMAVDQDFPASIEIQLLGGNGTDDRTTANLCTPGTNVVMDDRIILQHCTSSTSETYHGDQWVTVEIEVRGNEVIRHVIDGVEVLSYNQPQLDDRDAHARELAELNGGLQLSGGTISLQSESHPVEFRRVDLLPLE
jgi:hypothetical protein